MNFIGPHNAPTHDFAYYAHTLHDASGQPIGIWYAYTDEVSYQYEGDQRYTVFTPTARSLVESKPTLIFGVRGRSR